MSFGTRTLTLGGILKQRNKNNQDPVETRTKSERSNV